MKPMTRNHILTAAALIASVLTVPACKKSPGPESAKTTQEPVSEGQAVREASISASPNPVPAGTGQGTTTITWDTGDDSAGEVYVSSGTGEEKLFGKNSKASTPANWIDAGTTYDFRLYRGTEHKELLGSVKVTRPKK